MLGWGKGQVRVRARVTGACVWGRDKGESANDGGVGCTVNASAG